LAIAMATLGAGAFLIGSSLEPAGARTAVGNLPINAGARDRTDINAHNSPTVAINPAKPSEIAVVNRVDTPRFSCGLHLSSDGGVSKWEDQNIPFPAGEEDPPRCFAPDLAFSPDGTLYVTFVTLKGSGNSPNALWITSSRDGGHTLSTPAKILGPAPPYEFQTRLTADPREANRLYLSFLQADQTGNLSFPSTGNPIQFLRSDDGGATWVGPTRVSPPARARVIAPSTAIGPRGEIYLLYLDVGEDKLDYEGGHQGQGGDPYDGKWSLVLARSVDRGDTWQETVVDDKVTPIERFIVFFPAAPSLAVDQKSGQVYVTFHDGRLGDPDVFVWTSTNGGRAFGPAKKVNDNPAKDHTSQYLPKASVAPNGRLDVVYYDRRADSKNVLNEVSLQSSADGAKTFQPRLMLTDKGKPFDSRIGFGSERKMPDLGSRLGLLSTDARTLAVWTDTRGGTEASNKQDLGRALVVFTKESPLRAPLRYGGPVLVVLGILVLLAWAAKGKSSAPAQTQTPESAE